MKPVDTSQSLTIFPKTISWGMIAGCAALAGLGLIVLPMAYQDREWGMVALGAGLGAVGLLMVALLIRKRRRGNPDPALMLSPEGLHFMTGTTGVVGWGDIKSLGSFSVKGNAALVINIDEAAIGQLNQSEFLRKSRKLDAAIGIHGLTFFQQQLEIPIPEVAQLLHRYSIAHGGPALQPDP